MTVADLKKKGAVALNDAQLKALIVDKSTWLENTVTGDKYQIIYGASGKSAIGKPLTPVEPGYVTQRFAANQGELQLRYVGRKIGAAEPDRRRGRAPAISAPPGRTSSATGRSSPRSSARRSRSPSTRWATSTWARAATSSGTPTTRSSTAVVAAEPAGRRARREAPLGPAEAIAASSRLAIRFRVASEPLGAVLALPRPERVRDGRQRWRDARRGWRPRSRSLVGARPTARRIGAGSAPRRAAIDAIELTADELRQMSMAWLAQGRPAPTPEQMRSLVEQGARGDPLPRGAGDGARQGRRRSSSAAWRRRCSSSPRTWPPLREPTADELRAWFEKNSASASRSPPAAELPPSLLLARPARRPRARGSGERAREARRPARGREGRGSARRSVHVPGPLPRPRAGDSRQGVRAAFALAVSSTHARLVAGADRVRLRLASRVRRFRDSRAACRPSRRSKPT